MNLDPFVESYRVISGEFKTEPNEQRGAFIIPSSGGDLTVIADNGLTTGWEHVSVSKPNRCPNWPEMSLIKKMFWGEEETVIEFHPPESQKVDRYPYCLHLWRPLKFEIPLPPQKLI